MRDQNPLAALNVIGGRLSLDFVNTTDEYETYIDEHLHAYADLAWWGLRVGVLDEAQARALLVAGEANHAAAADVLARALALRAALFRLFAAAENDASLDDVAVLNAELARAMAHLRVRPADGGFGWAWDDAVALDLVLWPVVRDAADLLVSEARKRIGRCGGEKCDWLFLDTSKNRSRRWCDMQTCGNRAKARRHYHRTHPSPSSEG